MRPGAVPVSNGGPTAHMRAGSGPATLAAYRLGLFDFLDDRAAELALDEFHAGRAGTAIGGPRVVGPLLVQARGAARSRGPAARAWPGHARRGGRPPTGCAGLGRAARPARSGPVTGRRRPRAAPGAGSPSGVVRPVRGTTRCARLPAGAGRRIRGSGPR